MNASDLLRKSPKKPDPSRDQHFLMDDEELERITESAPSGHVVLEIGGGIGNLTDKLNDKYREIKVVEKDREYYRFLEKTYPEIEVIHNDVLELELDSIEFDVCVSNPPYSISTPLLFKLLPLGKPVVFTLQKELAMRIVAEPGSKEYGRLTVTARHYSSPSVEGFISKNAFRPSPEVDTAIVSFNPTEPEYGDIDVEFFMDFTRAIFTQRRKTLRNAVRNTTHITGLEEPDDALSRLDDELVDRRPDNLTPMEIASVSESLIDG